MADESSDHHGPWGPGASVFFTVVVFVIMVVVQSTAALALAQIEAARHRVSIEELGEGAVFDGDYVAVATVTSMPVVLLLVVLMAARRRKITLRDYLGLKAPTSRQAAAWAAAMLALIVAMDLTTWALDRPIVPEIMVDMYHQTDWTPLLVMALVIAAPVAEETLIRGFLYPGLRHSSLGVGGALGGSAFLWAVVHMMQYDAYGVIMVFAAGIFLGLVREHTGSLYLCIALHGLMNLIATLEIQLLTTPAP